MPKPARDVAAALVAKGFRKTENDHTFTLWVDGKKTVIHPKSATARRSWAISCWP